jgi:hypothetical protein
LRKKGISAQAHHQWFSDELMKTSYLNLMSRGDFSLKLTPSNNCFRIWMQCRIIKSYTAYSNAR